MIDYTNAIDRIHQYLTAGQSGIGTREIAFTGSGAIKELEEQFCHFYKSKHALCTNNATNALYYLGLVFKLRNCDIVTTPLSHPATLSGLLNLGCKFHFANLDANLNICPDSVEKIITENPKVKAILSVDFAGTPHNTFQLRQIADKYRVVYIADAAQSLGASINNIKASSLSDAWVTSFCPGKTIFAGEGACIMTNRTDVYQNLMQLTQHVYRQKIELGLNAANEFSLNGRINPLAAIIASSLFSDSMRQLKSKQDKCEEIIAHLLDAKIITRTISDYDFSSAFFYFLFESSADYKTIAESRLLSRDVKIEKTNFRLLPDLMKAKQVRSFQNRFEIEKRLQNLYKVALSPR